MDSLSSITVLSQHCYLSGRLHCPTNYADQRARNSSYHVPLFLTLTHQSSNTVTLSPSHSSFHFSLKPFPKAGCHLFPEYLPWSICTSHPFFIPKPDDLANTKKWALAPHCSQDADKTGYGTSKPDTLFLCFLSHLPCPLLNPSLPTALVCHF